MYDILKRFASIALIGLVLFFTVLSILAIWEIIEVRNILNKSLGSLMVIFVSSAIVLFIVSVVFKSGESHKPNNPPRQGQNPNPGQNPGQNFGQHQG
ncbi:MAG: hypothetical protein KKA07_00395 [Bacteroidetes bacterium]|nr:hypothetical protein [Bacteroidota bacterium]MBU1717510.1 hypothetical protein [Bacteroidota bacterium]